MARLIDADVLKDRLHEALEFQESIDNYEGAELFEIAKDIADEQPTIDAIPVEWMVSWINRHPNDLRCVWFASLEMEWRKEQEER